MKAVIQHDIRDCGAACLKMIADFHGLKLSFSKCRELTKTDRTGTNIYGLIDGARKIGLQGNALSGTVQELLDGIDKNEFKYPFIAHTISLNGFLHFVVVLGKKGDKFLVADPEEGKKYINEEEFFGHWTGYIITFEKLNTFQKANYTKGSFLKFFSLINKQLGKLISVLVMSLVISVISILSAFVFQLVIDNFGIETGYYGNEEHENCEDEACAVCVNENKVETTDNIIEIFLEKIVDIVEHIDFSIVFIVILYIYFVQSILQFIRGKLILLVSITYIN